MERQKLQNSTLILILGIASIITCCCYGVVGLIVGIIAIVLAKKATAVYAENPEMYDGFQNVKIGRVLAIIGVILSLLYLLFVVWAVMTFGWEAFQDQELLQERMREYMENQ